MKIELRSIHSPDISDLENFIPADENCFSIFIQLFVGPSGEEGEESFDIEICTPRWIESNYEKDKVILGRHKLIVQQYNFNNIHSFITEFLENCTGSDWNSCALKASRLGKWEFEDYVE